MERPEPIERPRHDWDLINVPDGAPLLSGGVLYSANRDASFNQSGRPASRIPRFHVLVNRHGVAKGKAFGYEAPACGQSMLIGGMYETAYGAYPRCQRPACAELFAKADAERTARTSQEKEHEEQRHG